MAYIPDEAVYESHKISHTAFKLYVCYCAHRNSKNGLAWPDRDTIHEATGIDVNYVSTLKKELEKKGWIVIEGKRVRPVKGFQNPSQELNDSITETANKEDNPISIVINEPEQEKLNGSMKKLDDSFIGDADTTFPQGQELNDSIEKLNGSSQELNDSILHIKEIEPVEEPIEEPRKEREALPLWLAVPDAARQVGIFERYYPGFAKDLSIFQQELLGSMENLEDCESAIRYAAGNGFRARSVDKIVNQVFANREWERDKNATSGFSGSNGNSRANGAQGKPAPGGYKTPKPNVANVLPMPGSGMGASGGQGREAVRLSAAGDNAESVSNSPGEVRKAEAIPLAAAYGHPPRSDLSYRFN